MASYRIEWKRSAEKELRRLPKGMIGRVVSAVTSLAKHPYPSGIRKLVGSHSSYRLRVGEYRVIYTVEEDRLIIEVVRIGHRREVYRKR